MKITEEQFNELNQLNRIEFRQRYNLIYEGIGTLLLVSLIFFLGNYFIGALIFLVWGLISSKKAKKLVNKLEEEYFTTQVKRNERRKL